MVWVLTTLIKVYQKIISPMFPPRCRFTPSCSNYAVGALTKFGSVKGCYLIIKRVLRCHPFHPGGYDPVP